MGAVNIFLGGTGKFIAEDIQDSRDFYPHMREHIGDPVAFDLDAATRAGVQLRGFVSAGERTTEGVRQLAGEWVALNPGRGLGPPRDAGKPGPQTTPEHQVLVSIGESIRAEESEPDEGLYALRAHGLAVFSMMFDSKFALAGAGPGNDLRRHIDDRVRQESEDGNPPRINLVTSTAGGTGAGMVIPLALWLKRQYQDSEINLVAVTASAFTSVLSGAAEREEIRARGLSGTYALLREISFFHEVDTATEFPIRQLPMADDGLIYRPGGGRLFHRIYWFGGRARGGGTAIEQRDDAFREAEPLLRVLSTNEAANALDGATGASPLRWVGAMTAIEYPKLRLQNRIVFRVLEDAYRSLREPAAAYAGASAASDEVSLLGYVGADTDRPLGAWFYAQRDGAMARRDGHVTRIDADDLTNAVQQVATLRRYDAVQRGTDIRGGNYDSDEAGWRRYVAQVVGSLRSSDNDNQRSLGNAVTALRRDEQAAFDRWLRETVYGRWLSASGGGEPRATGEVLEMLDVLEQDAIQYTRRFESDDLFPVGAVEEANDRVQRQEEKFEKPDDRDATATKLDRLLALGVAALVGVVAAIVANPISDAIPEFAGGLSRFIPWIVVVALAIGARQLTFHLRLRSRVEAATTASVRRAAEDALIAAYRDRDRVRALRWLQQELRGEGEAFFEVLRQRIAEARAEVKRLDDVYKGLQDRATSRVTSSDRAARHVRAEIGVCLDDDPNLTKQIGPELRSRIRVAAAGRLRMRLEHADKGDMGGFEQAAEDVADLYRAIAAEGRVGEDAAKKSLGRWEDAAWSLVQWRLGAELPNTFHEALLHCEGDDEALRSLASRLANINMDQAQEPSVRLRSKSAGAGQQRVYTGSEAIRADLAKALDEPTLDRTQQALLRGYLGQGHVVPSLGEQIVFLDLWADPGSQPWAPGVIGNAEEVIGNDGAKDTYYGVTPGLPPKVTAEGRAFTVIPELLAATKIELALRPVEPLAPAVVARLLGCDLDMQGPTYAELFYLLRHRDWLRSREDGTGPEARTVTVIGDDGDAMPLVSRQRGNVADEAFGAGRAAVIDFDTFVEFMRYDGRRLTAGADVGFRPFPASEPQVHTWAAAPARVAALQRMAVEAWYRGDVEGDAEAMLAVLEGDLAAMANGDAAVRSSWERAMRRLLAGKERKEIRSILAAPPAPPAPAGP